MMDGWNMRWTAQTAINQMADRPKTVSEERFRERVTNANLAQHDAWPTVAARECCSMCSPPRPDRYAR